MSKTKIWFTADLHLRHDKILELEPGRGFKDVMEMEKAYLDWWNKVIAPGDIVYVVGDFAFVTSKNRDELAAWLKAANGTKILVRGNHDCCTKKKYRELGFAYFVDVAYVGGFTLFHDRDRASMYKHEAVVICGHSHSEWIYRPAEDDKPAFVNVGVDATKCIAVDSNYVASMVCESGAGWIDPRENVVDFWTFIRKHGGHRLERALLEFMIYANNGLREGSHIASGHCWSVLRGEEYGSGALAVIMTEGLLYNILNCGEFPTVGKKIQDIFKAHGFYVDGIFSWAWGVFPL